MERCMVVPEHRLPRGQEWAEAGDALKHQCPEAPVIHRHGVLLLLHQLRGLAKGTRGRRRGAEPQELIGERNKQLAGVTQEPQGKSSPASRALGEIKIRQKTQVNLKPLALRSKKQA